MKKILLVVVIIIFITLLLPLAIVWLIGGGGEGQSPIEGGTVSVYVSEEDCVKDMDINEYLKCVVAAEMPADFEEEALKAQAVAARTYLYSHIAEKDKGNIAESHNGAAICTDSTHCQAYISEDKRRESWGAGADENWNKISTAVDETTGQIMTYNDEIISAVFHSTSSGITESAVDVWGADVPYLQSVASAGDEESPKYHSELTLSEQEFKNIAEEKIDGVDWNNGLVSNINRSNAGGIVTLDVGGVNIKGTEFRNIFSIEATNNTGKDNLFNSGVFTLIKGRHIEKDDREKIIIHEELAQKNNLELNDKIRLELFDLNNNEIKTEYEFEIIGIFSGKKQEKYTGMTSDFSENMVFIDYESSQAALNKAENNKVVNKLEIISDSSKDTNIVLNKIKEIKIDWSKFNIEKNDDVYEETLESVEGIKHIIKVMTYSIMTGGITVLSLILILWLRERIYEIGILLSIGIIKAKIIAQFIFELIFISLPSILASLFLGNVILNQIIGGFINSDNSTININNLLKNDNLISNITIFLQSYGILIVIIVLSVIIASAMILVKKPKEILSKIS